jgi:hypothetical protein
MKRFLAIALVVLGACGRDSNTEGQNAKQRAASAQSDEAAKKGALTEQLDPKIDLEQQERNLRRLRLDEAGSRAAGNHAAVWAVRWDIHRTAKLIDKDKQLSARGAAKELVDNPAAAKAEQKGRAQ